VNLHEFLESDHWQYWDAENRSPGSARMILAAPERFERCWAAAENGAEGSTHREVISDWRRALACIHISEHDRRAIEREIDECEQWHEQNGSLDEEIG